MLFVTTQPEALSATAATLAGIGNAMSAQNAVAAAPTTSVAPAAADEVSALTATQFALHAQMYQAISAQAEAIHQQLVSTLAIERDFICGDRSRQCHDSELRRDTAMDFAMLPPEINSGRMYAGPGTGPMLAAAAAWDGLAAELQSTAASYRSAISELTDGPWLGASSASMAAATAPYLAWMATAAGQAEHTATQAKAAAAAYETAFAMTVPPAVIAANRSLLMALIATNVLGQNTAAIAATETDYAEMWAQDAAAMYGYAGSSAAATTLTPFTSPPPTTNPAGQSAAVAQSLMSTGARVINGGPPGVAEPRDVGGGDSSGPGV